VSYRLLDSLGLIFFFLTASFLEGPRFQRARDQFFPRAPIRSRCNLFFRTRQSVHAYHFEPAVPPILRMLRLGGPALRVASGFFYDIINLPLRFFVAFQLLPCARRPPFFSASSSPPSTFPWDSNDDFICRNSTPSLLFFSSCFLAACVRHWWQPLLRAVSWRRRLVRLDLRGLPLRSLIFFIAPGISFANRDQHFICGKGGGGLGWSWCSIPFLIFFFEFPVESLPSPCLEIGVHGMPRFSPDPDLFPVYRIPFGYLRPFFRLLPFSSVPPPRRFGFVSARSTYFFCYTF